MNFTNSFIHLQRELNVNIYAFTNIKWYTQRLLSPPLIMTTLISDNEVDSVEDFLFLQLCIRALMTQRYRQQSRCWWRVLSVFTNPGLWIHVAEHALSLLHRKTPSFVSLLHLNLFVNFVAVVCLILLGITAMFVVFSFYHFHIVSMNHSEQSCCGDF